VHDSVFSFDCRVGVEKGASPGKKKERRPKTVYYIHKLVFDHGGGRKKISAGVEEVRMFLSCPGVIVIYMLLFVIFFV
jgi:hypothetical protein